MISTGLFQLFNLYLKENIEDAAPTKNCHMEGANCKYNAALLMAIFTHTHGETSEWVPIRVDIGQWNPIDLS